MMQFEASSFLVKIVRGVPACDVQRTCFAARSIEADWAPAGIASSNLGTRSAVQTWFRGTGIWEGGNGIFFLVKQEIEDF